jgi:hypothetical protein
VRYDEIYEGQKVLVWDWREEYDNPPDHWNQEMEEFIGAVVTIAHAKNHDIYIEEDEGRFWWSADDFDYYEILPPSDPNLRFRNHQQYERYRKMREKHDRAEFLKRLHKDHKYATER